VAADGGMLEQRLLAVVRWILLAAGCYSLLVVCC
jgi:hypothetical protein